jgi:hypothetical protein
MTSHTEIQARPLTRTTPRHAELPDARPIWIGAVIATAVLLITGVALFAVGLLSLAALALLGSFSAGIAALKQRRRKAITWALTCLAGITLLVVLFAGINARP